MVVFKTKLTKEAVSEELYKEIYQEDSAYHTLYFGEIVATYET